MRLLDKIMEANQRFVVEYSPQPMEARPRLKAAVVTCMDTRLVNFLEPAMGLTRGDVKLIKNAGNTITEGNDDVLCSLVVAVYELGVEEIIVVGHTRCGMAHAKPEELVENMRHRGIKEEVLGKFDFAKWLGLFKSEAENVRQVVGKLKESPLLPADIPIHGLLIDIDTGAITVLVNGYKA